VLGGDPVLYQHLFWFFGHPEVYIIIIPIFGLVSMLLTGIVRKELFGREGMIYCIGAIGIVGFFVWAHHMFQVGMDIDSRAYFSAATAIISIPTAVKVFSYVSTWSGGRGPKGSAISWSFWSFVICFTFGGFSGLFLSSALLDHIFHDTCFVVAHFHTVLSLGAVFGLLTAQYYYSLVFFGLCGIEGLNIYQVYLVYFGANFIFFPMHWLGLAGMSRRVPEFMGLYQASYMVGFVGTIFLVWSVILILRALFICVGSPLHGGYL
jgi:heme/copper-type cytochrome/quinol oxidase subunit 1